MYYEVDIARRYLHFGAIGRFYLGLLVVAAIWAGFYLLLATGVAEGFRALQSDPSGFPPWSPSESALAIQITGAVLGLLIMLACVWWTSGHRLVRSLEVVGLLVVLFLAQRFAVRMDMLDETPLLNLPLLVATAGLAGSLMRFTLRVPFITVLTSTSMFGVAIGVAAIIVVLSVMNGFDKDFHKKILGVKSHLAAGRIAGVQDWSAALDVLRELPNTASVHPTVEGLALVHASNVTRSALVRGIVPRTEPAESFLRQSVYLGSLDDLAPGVANATGTGDDLVDIEDLEPKPVPIFVGTELAKHLFRVGMATGLSDEAERERLSTVLGRRIRIVAAELGNSAMGMSTKTVIGQVVGLFRSRFYDFDANMLFVGLDTGQYLYGLGSGVNRIEVRLENFQPVPTNQYAYEARRALTEQVSERIYVETWMDMDPIFYESLVIERRMMALILSIIVIVASCNILTTLVMVVMEKTRDIGILRAIGATQRGVMAIFIAQGMIICSMGIGAGCLLAAVICWSIRAFEISLPGGKAVYYIDHLPVQMEASYFINVIVFTLLLGFLATLYPAYRASRLVPVEAIRYE